MHVIIVINIIIRITNIIRVISRLRPREVEIASHRPKWRRPLQGLLSGDGDGRRQAFFQHIAISRCAVVRDLTVGQRHPLAPRWSMEEHLAQSYVSGLPSKRRGTARHDNTVSEAARGHFDIDDQAATSFAA